MTAASPIDENIKLLKLAVKEDKGRIENYNINSDFAFYRGTPVDYKRIKRDFILATSKIFSTDENLLKLASFVTEADAISERKVKENLEKIKKEKEKYDELEKTTSSISSSSTPPVTSTELSEEDKKIDISSIYTSSSSSYSISTSSSEIYTSIYSGTESQLVGSNKYNLVSGDVIDIKFPPSLIGIFFNLNGTSKTRKNYILINKKAYKVEDLTKLLELKDRTVNGDGAATERNALTVERIAVCFAEETRIFLEKNPSFSKILPLKEYGFTKSFYCNECLLNSNKTKEIYQGLIDYAKTWDKRSNRSNQKPERFSEKMKIYFKTILKINSDIFDAIDHKEHLEKERRRLAIVV